MASATDRIDSIQFVKLYQSHRVLWDYNNVAFYDKELRASAFRDMSSKLNIPVKEIKRKITNIRGILRKEKFKQRQITSPGGTPYISKWYLFKHLTFLLDIKNNHPKLKRQETDEDLSDTVKIEVREDEETHMQPENNREERNNSENLSFVSDEREVEDPIAWVSVGDEMQDTPDITKFTNNISRSTALNVFSQADDVYDNFGKLIASELRKYDLRTLAYVKKAIMDVIFKADTDTLDMENQ